MIPEQEAMARVWLGLRAGWQPREGLTLGDLTSGREHPGHSVGGRTEGKNLLRLR